MPSKCVAAALLSFALVPANARISPPLHPASDKKFFGKDYPDDGRPHDVTDSNFGHPYPSVQRSADFDADFVRDENSDSGEWQSQMEYDMLRAKVRRLKEEFLKAGGAAAHEKEVYDAAYDKAIAAGHSAEEARAKAEAARKKHEDAMAAEAAADAAAKAARDKANGKYSGPVDESAVKEAEENLKKEEFQFKICEEELFKAQQALKKALEDADNEGKQNAAAGAAHQKAAQAEADKDDADAQALKGKEGEAASAEAAANGEESALEQKMKELQAQADAMLQKVKLGKMSVEQAQKYVYLLYDQLKVAEARLKYFRQHGGPPPAGWEDQFFPKATAPATPAMPRSKNSGATAVVSPVLIAGLAAFVVSMQL